MDSSEGITYITSICYPLQDCYQNNWGTRQKWWGKMEPVLSLCRQYVALEHDTYLQFMLGWGYPTFITFPPWVWEICLPLIQLPIRQHDL